MGSAMSSDLSHDLIPDPVAEAIACLLERIRLREHKVGTDGCLPGVRHRRINACIVMPNRFANRSTCG